MAMSAIRGAANRTLTFPDVTLIKKTVGTTDYFILGKIPTDENGNTADNGYHLIRAYNNEFSIEVEILGNTIMLIRGASLSENPVSLGIGLVNGVIYLVKTDSETLTVTLDIEFLSSSFSLGSDGMSVPSLSKETYQFFKSGNIYTNSKLAAPEVKITGGLKVGTLAAKTLDIQSKVITLGSWQFRKDGAGIISVSLKQQ